MINGCALVRLIFKLNEHSCLRQVQHALNQSWNNHESFENVNETYKFRHHWYIFFLLRIPSDRFTHVSKARASVCEPLTLRRPINESSPTWCFHTGAAVDTVLNSSKMWVEFLQVVVCLVNTVRFIFSIGLFMCFIEGKVNLEGLISNRLLTIII